MQLGISANFINHNFHYLGYHLTTNMIIDAIKISYDNIFVLWIYLEASFSINILFY